MPTRSKSSGLRRGSSIDSRISRICLLLLFLLEEKGVEKKDDEEESGGPRGFLRRPSFYFISKKKKKKKKKKNSTNLLPEPADARVVHLPGVLRRHVVHHRVDLSLERPHDRQRRHIERDAGARAQPFASPLGEEARAAADDVAGAAGGLDDDCFLCVCLCVCVKDGRERERGRTRKG